MRVLFSELLSLGYVKSWELKTTDWHRPVVLNGVATSSMVTAFVTFRKLTLYRLTVHEYVRFDVFTAVAMKNADFWNMTPCNSCKNQRFGGTFRLHHHRDRNRRARNNVSSNYQLKNAVKFWQEPHGVTSQKTAFCKLIIHIFLFRTL
jgi:hypothetical protein